MIFLKLTKWAEAEKGKAPPEPRPIWVNAGDISYMQVDTVFGPRTLIFTLSACLNVVETPEEILHMVEAGSRALNGGAAS